MRAAGAILIILGFLLSLSIFGAVLGIPMMLIGVVMFLVGGRRKTIINNVVQVSNNAPAPVSLIDQSDRGPRHREVNLRAIEPSYVEPRLDFPHRQPTPAQIPHSPDFELTYDEVEFTDVRTELSQDAKRVLTLAKAEGFEIKARPESITLKRGDFDQIFRSNDALLVFGRSQGFR